MFAELTTSVQHALIYAEMLFNVFVVRSLDCAYEQRYGIDAAFDADRECREPVMYCTKVLWDGLNRLYDEQIHAELQASGEAMESATQLRLYGEREYVCSMPLMYPKCGMSPSCAKDLAVAMPYWLKLWQGENPTCPPPLMGYICGMERNGP